MISEKLAESHAPPSVTMSPCDELHPCNCRPANGFDAIQKRVYCNDRLSGTRIYESGFWKVLYLHHGYRSQNVDERRSIRRSSPSRCRLASLVVARLPTCLAGWLNAPKQPGGPWRARQSGRMPSSEERALGLADVLMFPNEEFWAPVNTTQMRCCSGRLVDLVDRVCSESPERKGDSWRGNSWLLDHQGHKGQRRLLTGWRSTCVPDPANLKHPPLNMVRDAVRPPLMISTIKQHDRAVCVLDQ